MRIGNQSLALAHRAARPTAERMIIEELIERRVLGVILGGIAAGMMGTDEMHAAMARELIERRAADLTAEDAASLVDAQRCMQFHCTSVDGDDKHHRTARAVLGKLIDAWRKAEAKRGGR